MNDLLFSVITVTFNCEREIKVTLESVASQTCDDYEYIVIDGQSKDKTVEIVKEHPTRVDVLASEPDKGIYDAMNKGINIAKGNYIIFMNAGDTFASPDVLAVVKKHLSESNVDLLAGSAKVIYPDHSTKKKTGTQPYKNSKYMPVCHQSLFAKRDVLLRFPFDLSYKLAADFNFIMHAINADCSFLLIEDDISLVSAGGVSDIKRCAVWNEYQRVHDKFNKPTVNSNTFYLGRKCMEIIKMPIKKILGKR